MSRLAPTSSAMSVVRWAQVPWSSSLLREVPEGFAGVDLEGAVGKADNTFVDRAALARTLSAYNASVGNALSDATVEALGTDGRLVITGQQPGLGTGPLYSIYKAITAIRLASDLDGRDGVPVLPAFWIASEDHDLAEVNHLYLGGDRFDAQHAEMYSTAGRPSVGTVSLQSQRDALLAFAEQQVGTLPHGGVVMDWLSSVSMDDYAAQFAQLLVRVFGAGRLVLVDPMKMRRLMAPALAHVVSQGEALQRAFEAGGERLVEAGMDKPLDRVGLFEMRDGLRRPVAVDAGLAKAIEHQPERYSPGAAIRPIVQDAVLPTVAMVGGPSELAYLWQIDPLYDVAGVTRAGLMPRLSATLLSEADEQVMAAHGYDDAQVLDARRLARSYTPTLDAADLDRIDTTGQDLLERLNTLDVGGRTRQRDRAMRSIQHHLQKLRTEVMHERLSQSGLGKDRLMELAMRVMPAGKPQERVVCGLDPIARWGTGWIESLVTQPQANPGGHVMVRMSGIQGAGR